MALLWTSHPQLNLQEKQGLFVFEHHSLSSSSIILFTLSPSPLVSTQQWENESQAQSSLELLTAEAVNELRLCVRLHVCVHVLAVRWGRW